MVGVTDLSPGTRQTDSREFRAIHRAVRALAGEFAAEGTARQRRRELDPHDFARLWEAGFLRTGVPVQYGGVWESHARSVRPIAALLRTLAHGDASVALVASMHPAVTASAGWLTTEGPREPVAAAWEAQRRWVFQTIAEGAWWGTISSEPGSGGDSTQTAAVARPAADGSYRLSGRKHFGSGAGIASYMITTAVPEGERDVDGFFLDLRGVPWDGSTGVTLLAPWDGHGMIATQSHALHFADFPATRNAWPMTSRRTAPSNPQGFVLCLWAGVILGIVETAVAEARRQLGRRRGRLRPFERVEWERVEVEAWLVEQAYEGMVGAVERTGHGVRAALTGKVAIAEHAEAALGRLCRVIGGGAYARGLPFGFWFEDVRALGFLRPPWGLAFDQLGEMTWAREG
jgi:alkylation response protein AidB-like acyl-CoA dehydrogenase